MGRLLLFNPENDIALARDTANFTAPKAALELKRSCVALPLWYGDKGDRVIIDGVNARWYDYVCERFGIEADVYDHITDDNLRPSPWGWSRAVKREFERKGVSDARLPDDDRLSQWREMSHRRTAAEVCARLQDAVDFDIAPPAVEISDIRNLEKFLASQPQSIVKTPWSSSGRGLIDCRKTGAAEALRLCEGIIKHQGSVMVETAYERTGDFAMLFECDGGRCRFVGNSLFESDQTGAWSGNAIGAEAYLSAKIGRLYSLDRLDKVRKALTKIIEERIAGIYDGPVGVDMLTAVTGSGETLLDATVEINLRMTMGFVAHELSRRYTAEGSAGVLTIRPCENNMAADECIVDSHRTVEGTVNLSPTGGRFRATTQIKRINS